MARKLTETQYLHLYNHLPPDSKDLVLGKNNLLKAISPYFRKFKISKDKEKKFMEAVEDILLGFVTIENTSKNLHNKLEVDIKLAELISINLKKDIFDKYSHDIKIARKYFLNKFGS